MFVYYFVDPDLRVETTFGKAKVNRTWGIDFEIVDIDTSAHSPLADNFSWLPSGDKT